MMSKETRPTFSIVIPVFNTEKYLKDCVDSVLSQSYRDFEVILVDDGSNDSSLAICRQYEAEDRRVKVLHKENGGVSSARNMGIDVATGKYITFIDADDYILEGSLDHVTKLIGQDNSDFIAGQVIKITKRKTFIYKSLNDGHNLNGECVKHLGGAFMRLDIIKDNKLKFTEGLAYSEDRVFLCETVLHCRTVTTSSRCLYTYRISENSVTNCVNGRKIMENQFRASKLLFRMARNPRYAKSRKQLLRHAQRTMKWGIYAIVKHSPEKQNYEKMKKMFSELFSCECEHPHMTYYKLLLTRHYLVYKQTIGYKLALASSKVRTFMF